jgi:FkbM family methyltransferase
MVGHLYSEKVKSIEIFHNKMVLSYLLSDQLVLKMQLNPEDLRSASMTIISEGSYEPILSSILFEIGKNCKSFVDIGANAGFYSLSMAILNPQIKVYAFEPNVSVAAVFSKNVELNQIGNRINLLNTALGSKLNEVRTLFIPKITGTGGGSLSDLHPEEGDAELQETKIDTLDNFCSNIEFIDLIKIDVEGFELEVINGALNVIESKRPVIFVELLRKWMIAFGHHPQNVVDLLHKIGYTSFAISDSYTTEIDVIDSGTIETNFLFVHKEDSHNLDLIKNYLR